MWINQQWHGYKRGHQLLATTTELDSRDQDLIDKLSDASGSPRPGERFEPYLTVYPLPSGQYHVVARTWQDLEATRSGTVFTRSLLIPRDTWRGAKGLRAIFNSLVGREITGEPVQIAMDDERWPAIDGPNLAALVEALFLEPATSVAAFGFNQTEEVSGRLLESMWPSRRSTMAVCTYALGPRSLPDRDFDLVFAPETARSRFAKWGGRKISASPNAPSARHQWTDQIEARIFRDPVPSLRELDEIGALEGGTRGDSSALRLALLWSELRQKAPSSPTSLLGMLDILRSLGRQPWVVPYLAGMIVRSLSPGTAGTPPADVWRYLQLLVRKLGEDIPLSVLRAIFIAARRLAVSQPSLVVSSSGEETAVPLPHLLRPAVARGLADLQQPELGSFLRSVSPDFSVALMAESPEFAAAVAASLSAEPDKSLIDNLAGIAADDRRAARRFASGVARGSKSSAIAPILHVAIASSPRENFEFLCGRVLTAGGTSRTELLNLLVDVSHTLMKQDALRGLALRAASPAEGDRLLLGLVHDPSTVVWLAEALANDRKRLYPLILKLMGGWSDANLRDVLQQGRSKDALLSASLSGLQGSGKAFARLLRILSNDGATAAALLRDAGSTLSDADLRDASLEVLDQLLSLDPKANKDLIQPLAASADPSRYISAATSTALTGAEVGRNIAFMINSQSVARFVPVVDLLTRRLVDRRTGGYGQEGYDGWAHLLRLASKLHPEALVRSADLALDYVMARLSEPAGAVAAAAFPVVHARLKKSSPDAPSNLFAAILMLPITLFTDWDRAKAARHGITEAFLRSEWEPVELLRAGLDAGILGKILGYLISRPGGLEYLRRMEAGVSRCPEPLRGHLVSAISEVRMDVP